VLVTLRGCEGAAVPARAARALVEGSTGAAVRSVPCGAEQLT